jgi:hypothetical protein
MGNVMEAVRKGGEKGPDGAPEVEAQKAPTVDADATVLFPEDSEAEDEKVHKLRLLFKGTALDDAMAFFGAKAVEGDKQVSFKVPSLGDREVGEVIRALFAKARVAGVTLKDLLAVIREKAQKPEAK